MAQQLNAKLWILAAQDKTKIVLQGDDNRERYFIVNNKAGGKMEINPYRMGGK